MTGGRDLQPPAVPRPAGAAGYSPAPFLRTVPRGGDQATVRGLRLAGRPPQVGRSVRRILFDRLAQNGEERCRDRGSAGRSAEAAFPLSLHHFAVSFSSCGRLPASLTIRPGGSVFKFLTFVRWPFPAHVVSTSWRSCVGTGRPGGLGRWLSRISAAGRFTVLVPRRCLQVVFGVSLERRPASPLSPGHAEGAADSWRWDTSSQRQSRACRSAARWRHRRHGHVVRHWPTTVTAWLAPYASACHRTNHHQVSRRARTPLRGSAATSAPPALICRSRRDVHAQRNHAGSQRHHGDRNLRARSRIASSIATTPDDHQVSHDGIRFATTPALPVKWTTDSARAGS